MQYVKTINLIFLLVLFVSISTANAEVETVDIICDEWPPYQIAEGTRIAGFSTKIVETVFKRMNVRVNVIHAYPWKRAIMMIEKGEADALFSVNYKEERARFAHYPDEEIATSSWVMWVREEDRSRFESLDDLVGKSIGLVRGYSYTPAFWSFVKKNASYEEVVGDEQNFKKLHADRVDVIIAELGNGMHIVKELELKGIIPIEKYLIKTDGLFIIFNKKNVEKKFVEKFSNELRKLKREDLYLKFYEEYFNL